MKTKAPADLAELTDLPATVDLPTAGVFFGMGRDASYRAAKAGDFPAPVLRVGGRLIVTKASLCAALGVPLSL